MERNLGRFAVLENESNDVFLLLLLAQESAGEIKRNICPSGLSLNDEILREEMHTADYVSSLMRS